MVLVSLGGDGAILISKDEILRGIVPHVEGDTVGAGDSTVAGFALGLFQNQPTETAFKMGLASGVSCVMNTGPGLCEPKTYQKAMSLVKIERQG